MYPQARRHHLLVVLEMTPERYRELLQALNLGHREMAAILEIDQRTSRRFASGKMSVPERIAGWLEGVLKTRPLPPR
jgi:hypothetical protein